MTMVKLAMQFGSASFSAEGSEQFVLDAYHKWSDLSQNAKFSATVMAEKSALDGQSNGKKTNSEKPETQYENVYDEVDGKLKIIAQMPGGNKADRTRNTALALFFGNFLRGQQTTSADDLRDACQDQGCYDSSNFASHLKGLKDKVAMNTKAGGGYDIKLTAPGRKAAQSFVETLNNAAE
jgi:hypothetical protein